MSEQTVCRKLNILAEGKQHRSHLQLGDTELRVNEATPERSFSYSNWQHVPSPKARDTETVPNRLFSYGNWVNGLSSEDDVAWDQRRLNILAEGKQHRSHLQLGDTELRVNEATPERSFSYSNWQHVPSPEEGATPYAAPCPCASSVLS